MSSLKSTSGRSSEIYYLVNWKAGRCVGRTKHKHILCISYDLFRPASFSYKKASEIILKLNNEGWEIISNWDCAEQMKENPIHISRMEKAMSEKKYIIADREVKTFIAADEEHEGFMVSSDIDEAAIMTRDEALKVFWNNIGIKRINERGWKILMVDDTESGKPWVFRNGQVYSYQDYLDLDAKTLSDLDKFLDAGIEDSGDVEIDSSELDEFIEDSDEGLEGFDSIEDIEEWANEPENLDFRYESSNPAENQNGLYFNDLLSLMEYEDIKVMSIYHIEKVMRTLRSNLVKLSMELTDEVDRLNIRIENTRERLKFNDGNDTTNGEYTETLKEYNETIQKDLVRIKQISILLNASTVDFVSGSVSRMIDVFCEVDQ